MKTNFSDAQMNASAIKIANDILRKCVHCGFCLATCPTYVILGNELDSPRGRIYQIRDMLERDLSRPASKQSYKEEKTAKHIDRCLSCLSCMTTCPSGVDYMHLVDHARGVIEKNYTRPLPERLLRLMLSVVLPNAKLFRLSLVMARLMRPVAKYMPGRLRVLVEMAPKRIPSQNPVDVPGTTKALGIKKLRVGLMPGCAQKTLNPEINAATVRLLTRLGADVVVVDGVGCCGALVHHMGMEEKAIIQAKENISAWMGEIQSEGLDAIVINASGCGTTVKDYGHMLKDDPDWAASGAKVSSLARDISEILLEMGTEAIASRVIEINEKPIVAYHSACSMQHGQNLKTQPLELLQAAGFSVREPKEPHLCCGSAGTYNIMQPNLADKLGKRKMENISATKSDIIATGNIGCMVQLANHGNMPVAHTVQLLDWATGGPKPVI